MGNRERGKIKRVLGVSWAGGEGWGVELAVRRRNPLVRGRESEGSGITGGMLVSWRLRRWSWGGSGNVPGGDHGGRARERKK